MDRLVSLAGGLAAVGVGFGLAGVALRYTQRFTLLLLPILAALSVIGLFGLNMVVQAVRGRGRDSGFFYALVSRAKCISPRLVLFGVPAFLVLAVVQGQFAGDHKAVKLALAMSAAWLATVGNVFVHELGHAIAAHSVGLPIERVVFGPLMICEGPNGPRWGLANDWLAVVGGYVLLKSFDVASARQRLLFALGGPVASLLLLAAAVHFNPYDYLVVVKASGPGPSLVLFAIVGSSFILIFNLLPICDVEAGFVSDGYSIREALKAMRRGL